MRLSWVTTCGNAHGVTVTYLQSSCGPGEAAEEYPLWPEAFLKNETSVFHFFFFFFLFECLTGPVCLR